MTKIRALIEQAGWHFSFIGDFEKIRLKLDSWAHTNENKYNPEYLANKDAVASIIKQGGDLFGRDYKYEIKPLSNIFPKYLINNKEKFSELLG